VFWIFSIVSGVFQQYNLSIMPVDEPELAFQSFGFVSVRSGPVR
jgi:hypothetical protein